MRRVCWSDNTVDNFVFVPHNFPYYACCCLRNLKIIQSINFKWAFVALESSKTNYWIVLFFSKNFVCLNMKYASDPKTERDNDIKDVSPQTLTSLVEASSQLWTTRKQYLISVMCLTMSFGSATGTRYSSVCRAELLRPIYADVSVPVTEYGRAVRPIA